MIIKTHKDRQALLPFLSLSNFLFESILLFFTVLSFNFLLYLYRKFIIFIPLSNLELVPAIRDLIKELDAQITSFCRPPTVFPTVSPHGVSQLHTDQISPMFLLNLPSCSPQNRITP